MRDALNGCVALRAVAEPKQLVDNRYGGWEGEIIEVASSGRLLRVDIGMEDDAQCRLEAEYRARRADVAVAHCGCVAPGGLHCEDADPYTYYEWFRASDVLGAAYSRVVAGPSMAFKAFWERRGDCESVCVPCISRLH